MKKTVNYFFDQRIDKSSTIISCLIKIFGVNRVRAVYICQQCGLLGTIPWGCLTEKQRILIRNWFEEKNNARVMFGSELQKKIMEQIKKYTLNNSYRGSRMRKGLPVNGQRTRRNAKTAKKLNSFKVLLRMR